jgi:sarcosine oxidase
MASQHSAITPDVDVVVIGGGAMGSSTAWELAKRGRDVLLLERFEPGHANGASHGASRNFNVAYAEPTFVDMLVESRRGWDELGEVLDETGIVNHGPNPGYARVFGALAAAGIPAEWVDPVEATKRWPGLRFTTDVLHTPSAGRLNADLAVARLQAAASALGAIVRHRSPVTRIDVLGDDLVRVTLADEVITARHIVVTVGAWTQKLAGFLPLPPLVVTQEQPAHFALLHDFGEWPGFNQAPDEDWWLSPIYGVLTPGEGVKAGWHGTGVLTDPDARTFLPEQLQLERLQRYAREWLPGVDPERFEAISCTYTTTPDSNFVLDAVGPVVVGAGFSGQGFKFVPAVGRILADLVDGIPAPPLFRFDAPRTGRGSGPFAQAS